MIDERFALRFEDWVELIRDHHHVHGSSGVGRITRRAPREGFVGDDPEAGFFYHPTIVDGVRAEDDLYRIETFGPIVGVASFDTFDEAIALANGHGYGLSSSIYTTDPLHAFRFRERVSAGMVSVNNSTSGAEAHLPFGGNGRAATGPGNPGVWVLDQFTRWQAMNWTYSGHPPEGPDGRPRTSPPILSYRLPGSYGGRRRCLRSASGGRRRRFPAGVGVGSATSRRVHASCAAIDLGLVCPRGARLSAGLAAAEKCCLGPGLSRAWIPLRTGSHTAAWFPPPDGT
jgi:hypothetical protein